MTALSQNDQGNANPLHAKKEGGSSSGLVDAVLSGLTYPVVALDGNDRIMLINPAGEEFFKAGRSTLLESPLSQYIAPDHPVFAMIRRVRTTRASISDQGIEFNSAKLGQRLVNLQVSAIPDVLGGDVPNNADISAHLNLSGGVILAIQERALAERLRGQHQFRGAARSMTSLSALLAHEIKNPLAGIRGAAELLKSGHRDPDALTGLIISETDRIAALLTRMESLAGGKDIDRTPVNIHEVINHCITLAQNSFGQGVEMISLFDPSLPDTEGDRDLLIQSLLNLIKNACEACDKKQKIYIRTFYNLGVHYAVARQAGQAVAPLVIEIEDHGSGIAPELKDHIFDPFVTNKSQGTGLGLALVASTIADHGGTIDVTSQQGKTIFRIGLPIMESPIMERPITESHLTEQSHASSPSDDNKEGVS